MDKPALRRPPAGGFSVTGQLGEIPARRGRTRQVHDVEVTLATTQGHVQRGPTVAWKVPQPSKKREIESLRTSWSLEVTVPVEYHAFQYPIDTDTARRGEDDDRVGASEAQIEGVGIVAINDPAFLCDQVALNVRELVSRRLGPTGIPVVLVKVNDGNTCDSTELPREAGFSGAPRTDDRYTLHSFNVVSVLRLNI